MIQNEIPQSEIKSDQDQPPKGMMLEPFFNHLRYTALYQEKQMTLESQFIHYQNFEISNFSFFFPKILLLWPLTHKDTLPWTYPPGKKQGCEQYQQRRRGLGWVEMLHRWK